MNSSTQSELEVAIVKTLAWFSLFDYPLTAFEVWRWLYFPGGKVDFFEVEKLLDKSPWLRGRVARKDGFFVLGGRDPERLITSRQNNFLDATRKLKKLRLATRYFSLLPFVRAVFACNSLAWHNTSAESDIDVLFVVRPGTIWLTRLLVVLPFAILRKRPFAPHQSFGLENKNFSFKKFFLGNRRQPLDPFCFSVFTTSDNLNFDHLHLKPEDPGFAFWIASFLPIFDRDNIHERIQTANNLPIPHREFRHVHESLKVRGFSLPLSRLKIFESVVGKLQKRFLPVPLQLLANKDSRVVVSDKILKFHSNDNREACRERWKKIFSGYL